MVSVTEKIHATYQIRREMSKTPDLATALLARLLYAPDAHRPTALSGLVARMQGGSLTGLTGGRSGEFAHWLYDYLTITRTVRSASFYPVHPALSLPDNGEGPRVDLFVAALAACFTAADIQRLSNALWTPAQMPPFERAIHDLIGWQLDGSELLTPATLELLTSCDPHAPAESPDGVLARAKDDLLALADATVGVQAFVAHAGRYIAFTLSRYLLARGGLDLALPIYTAPAADTHEGVRTLAHEIMEIHRTRLGDAITDLFRASVNEALGAAGDPPDEATAQARARTLFSGRGQIIPQGQYAELLATYGSFPEIALHYYWTHSGAFNRFLRQLHSAHLNLAKKAGFANSRSQMSRWHFYWLAPALVETLLLITQQRLDEDRILVAHLLDDWRARYGIALLIDTTWDDVYRQNFRVLGSPEALNEANLRRFTQILADRGRLHKNSDDFPWVILRD